MTCASLKKEISSVGVRLTEGQGNLPKVVLTSPHGRYIISDTVSYICMCMHTYHVGANEPTSI